MEKKITKRQVLEHILEMYSNDEMVVAYATHEIELLDNKKASSAMTKTQKENIELKQIIVDTLTELAKPVRITELQSVNETLGALSNQKVSALLTQLVNEKVITRVVDKKVAYFSI